MDGLYLFFLVVGVPLMLWFAFAGDADVDGFDVDVDGGGSLAAISLSTIASAMAVFGFVGLVGGGSGVGAVLIFIIAVIVAVVAGGINSAAFSWLKRNSSSSDVSDAELEGKIARVSLPVSGEYRGKIIVEIAGAREQMTASPADGSSMEPGARVVIVKIEDGVALVAPLGPDLELQ